MNRLAFVPVGQVPERAADSGVRVEYRWWKVFAGGVLLAVSMENAWGYCYAYPSYTASYNPSVYFSSDMGTVNVSPDAAVGAVIATKTFPVPLNPDNVPAFNCPSEGAIQYVLDRPTLPGLPNVMETKVAGIGIRIGFSGRFFFPQEIRAPNDVFPVPGQYVQIELVKTAAETGSGDLSEASYVASIKGDSDYMSSRKYQVWITNTAIVTSSCSVDAGSRNKIVPLGKAPLKSFTAPGAASVAASFNIQLNCRAGAMKRTAYLQMDATRDPSNVPGVLQLAQGGSDVAKGVGIQLRDAANNAVQFGAPMLIGPAIDGVYQVPFTARYYQTGPNVTPGVANGTATFTLSYQ